MAHRSYALARVAVLVRAPGRLLWWLGVAAAAVGLFVPGFTGRRIGLLGGAALFLVTAACTYALRRGRHRRLAYEASRAGRSAILQDRKVTARVWWRARRWWVVLTFALAAGSSVVASSAGGMALAGVGAGLWAKAVWLGRWERKHDVLLWVRPEAVVRRESSARQASGYETTGPLAGDTAPGGGRRRDRAGAATARPARKKGRRPAATAKAR